MWQHLFERVAQRILPALERRDLSLNIELADDVTTLSADQQRLEQILGHLLSNAIGFSNPKGTVTLGCAQRRASLQIWVADRGKGIDPDFQPKAFDRFQAKPIVRQPSWPRPWPCHCQKLHRTAWRHAWHCSRASMKAQQWCATCRLAARTQTSCARYKVLRDGDL